VSFLDHFKKRALTQLGFDTVEFTTNALVLRIEPVIKRESFVYTGQRLSSPQELTTLVAHTFLSWSFQVSCQRAIKFLFLEKFGLSVLLVGRFIRTIWCNVAGLFTDIARTSFGFRIRCSGCSWIRIAHLFWWGLV
jgi:hypothetical protein